MAGTTLHPIRLTYVNAFLLIGEGVVLVDSGHRSHRNRLLRALSSHRLSPSDISLIVHTHAHPDHFGSTASLNDGEDFPAALHPDDMPLFLAGGHRDDDLPKWLRLLSRLLPPAPDPGFRPGVDLEHGMRLDPWGVSASILHTPGHTAGSVSLLLDGGKMLIGDLLLGSQLPGLFRNSFPRRHLLVDDEESYQTSIRQLLEAPSHVFYPSHGHPFTADQLRQKIDRLAPAASQTR
jgi:glyoxylase-like metal-dependent hydrolase (beta-lactamase superfamily II)